MRQINKFCVQIECVCVLCCLDYNIEIEFLSELVKEQYCVFIVLKSAAYID